MPDEASRESTTDAPGTPGPRGALTVVPRDIRADRVPNSDAEKGTERQGPQLELTALTLDSKEAERVAFAMWREGRTDDAIAFLEREILLEKDRMWKRETFAGRREPHFGKPAPEVIVPPVIDDAKPKRRSKRSGNTTPVSEPHFSDASAPVIDLTAQITAKVPPEALPERHMGRGPAVVAAIGLIIVGAAAAANIWDNHRAGTRIEHVAPALGNMAPQTSSALPAKAEATPKVTAEAAPAAAAQTPAVTPVAFETPTVADTVSPTAVRSAAEPLGPPMPPQPTVAAEASMPAPEPVDAAPPAAPEEAVALAEPQDDPAAEDSATPPDELDEAALPDEEVPPDDAVPPDEAAPPAEPLVARLPRQRPEPPANLVLIPPRPTQVSPAPAQAYQATPNNPIDARPPEPKVAALPQPFYDAGGLPARSTLTPAEYQALLERRAAAEDYVAQRHALAEEMGPPQRRVLLRLLRR